MALATLSIDIEARLAKLEEGMSKSVRLSERAAANITQQWTKLDNVGSNFAVGLKAALAGLTVGALIDRFKQLATGLDALNDAADATGASIENLSALEDIGARTGASFDTVTTAIVKFNNALKEADGKNGVSLALEAIGVSVEDLRRLDPAEALRRTAVALNQYADDGSKARVIQELFGKSVREVAPFLHDLARAGELNAKVTTEQAEQAEKFNQQLAAMRKNSEDFARSIVGDALPALNKFLETWTKLGGIKGIFDSSTTQLEAAAVGKQLSIITAQIERNQALISRSGGESNPSNAKAVEGLRLLRAEYDRLQGSAAGLSDKLKGIGDRVIPPAFDENGFEGIKRSIGELPAAAKLAKEKIDKILDPTRFDVPFPGLKEALKRIEDTDVGKLARLQEELTALIRLDGQDPTRPGLGEAIATIRGEIDKLTPAGKHAAEILKQVESIFAATDSGQASSLRAQLGLLDEALADGFISAEKYGAAIDDLHRRLDSIGKADPGKGLDQLDERFKQFGGNVQDVLAQGFEDSWSNAGRGFERMLKRMIAQAAAAQLGNVLFGDLFKTGQTGGLLGALLNTVGAGSVSTTGSPLGGGATDTLVPRGTTFNKGGGITYAPTINVSGGSNRSEVYAAATKAARESNRQFLDAVQRGIITLPSGS